MSKEKILLLCVTIGMLLIAAAIIIPIITVLFLNKPLTSPLFKYLFTAGSVLVFIGRVFNQYKGSNPRLKRLFRIETWSAVFFCVASVFMFYPPSPYGNDYQFANMRDVLAFTLAGAIIQIYTSIVIPREAKKDSEGNGSNKK